MPWALTRLRDRMLLSYIPAVLLTVVATTVAGWAFRLALRYGDQVLESTRLIGSANELRSHIVSAQSSIRGFAITGEESYLSPYEYACHEVDRQRDLVGERWSERSEQRRDVLRALDLFAQWRDEVAEPVIVARRPPVAETTSLLMRGRPLIDEAVGLLDSAVQAERRIVDVHSRENEAVVRWGIIVTTLAPLLALAYVLGASFRLTRRTVRAVESVSRAAETFAAGDLSRRVGLDTSDELGALARNFNIMAERLARRTEETQRFIELTQTLQVALSTAEMGELFETSVPQLLSVPAAHLYLNDSEDMFVPLAGWGPSSKGPFPSEACWAVRLGRAYRSTGHDGPSCEHLETNDDLSSLCVPMVVQSESLGLIVYRYANSADESAIRRAGADVAERFALALSNLRLRERLREQAIRDPLTGLYNRRYLDETFDREIERARRLEQPLGVLMIDIDHFKSLNDTEGHAAGDMVLREVGKLLISAFRISDEAYRYGGEEFLVLLPNAGVHDVNERACLLQEWLRRLRVHGGAHTAISITVSMGISCYPEDGTSRAELLRRADEALYQAKEAGRDRIVVARHSDGGAPWGPDSPS